MSSETEREAFEAWMRRMFPVASRTSLGRLSDGGYQLNETDLAWDAWQARATHRAEPLRTVTGDGAVALPALPKDDLENIVEDLSTCGIGEQQALTSLCMVLETYARAAVAQVLKAQPAQPSAVALTDE